MFFKGLTPISKRVNLKDLESAKNRKGLILKTKCILDILKI